MHRVVAGTLIVGLLALPAQLSPAPPGGADPLDAPGSCRSLDQDSYFDANLILMMVYNNGHVAYDNADIFGRPDGFYYPYSGNPEYPGLKTVVYAAGLWLGGKVNGEIRVAVAEYWSEFVPGPMSGGGPQPDDPSFRVYTIDQSSGPGDPDYDEWPAADGAPVDEFGDPLLMGDQTLWAVFNDADPSQHAEMDTEPLGIEIQQTVWGSDDQGEQIVLYIKYKLYNKGYNQIDSFYIAFWADPDLGYANDDLAGCDSALNIFFCYNDGQDPIYGDETPAWGGKVLSGPVVPSPGDTAVFDGDTLFDHRNLGMSSFSRYINGTDPQNAEQVYNYMRGWQIDGTPYVDPTNGHTTRFPYSGDPVTGTGWLDQNSSDRRLMISIGPLSFAPGDSQQVVLKLGADTGANPLNSVSKLKVTLDSAATDVIEPPEVVECDSVQLSVTNYGAVGGWYWDGPGERWLQGVDFGGAVFFGGADNGINFLYGSSLDPATDPDLFHTVEVRFSNTSTQRAYRYLRGYPPWQYDYTGYYEVPFTVWDIDDNRQVNAAFVETDGSLCLDYTWGPCGDDFGWGSREYLFLLNTDYSETENPAYMDNMGDVWSAGNFDCTYSLWPRLRPGHDLSELADSQRLGFFPQKTNPNGTPDSIIIMTHPLNTSGHQDLTVTAHSGSISALSFSTGSAPAFYTNDAPFCFEGESTREITVHFDSPGPGICEDTLYVVDMITGVTKAQMKLIGITPSAHAGQAILDPDVMYAFYTNYAGEDPMLGTVYVGDLEDGYVADEALQGSVRINQWIVPYDISVIPYHPMFTGEVLKIDFLIPEFVSGYGEPMWDTTSQLCEITGQFADYHSFSATYLFTMIGHISGDADASSTVDIDDAIYIVRYIFTGGAEPVPYESADVDCSGSVDVDDVAYLIAYIFSGGNTPRDTDGDGEPNCW